MRTRRANVIIVNENVIARKFNEYFINSIVDIVDSIPKYTSQDDVAMTYPILEEFIEFRKISYHELKGGVRDLKNVGGSQHGISNRVLSDVCNVVANRLLEWKL